MQRLQGALEALWRGGRGGAGGAGQAVTGSLRREPASRRAQVMPLGRWAIMYAREADPDVKCRRASRANRPEPDGAGSAATARSPSTTADDPLSYARNMAHYHRQSSARTPDVLRLAFPGPRAKKPSREPIGNAIRHKASPNVIPCASGSHVWGESTHDDSALGRRRAVPAPYVHAIIEVKASLTKRSIEDALRKLREVNDFTEKSRPSFCCGTVFAEVKRGLLSRSALIEEVRAPDITGYFGGIVLRAESLEPRLAGYFTFLDSEKSEPMMPLARDPGGLVIDKENRPVLTERGDVAEVVALEGKWNFDKGYSPLVRGVHLHWSYNSFPRFALDLLERLDGVYNPQAQKKRMHYGMSYSRRPEA